MRRGEPPRYDLRNLRASEHADLDRCDVEVLQDVPEEIKARAALTETKGESSLRGHLKAEGDEQSGSQSYVPPEQKDDKALTMALELMRGSKSNPAFPPNPKQANLPN